MDEDIIKKVAKIETKAQFDKYLQDIFKARKEELQDRVVRFYAGRLPYLLKSSIKEVEAIHQTQLELGASDEEINKTYSLLCALVDLIEKFVK